MPQKRTLNEAERGLLEAAVTGLPFSPVADGMSVDVTDRGSWSSDRRIRAEVIGELVTGKLTPRSRALRQVFVFGARITGQLDLDAVTMPFPLVFMRCRFDDEILLSEARTQTVRFAECAMKGIDARYLRADGPVSFDGSISKRAVRLDYAQLPELALVAARLADPDGHALAANWMTVERGVAMNELVADGGVAVGGSRIGGVVDLRGARLTNRGKGDAFEGDALSVGGYLACSDGFVADGGVSLAAADVGGDLDLTGARLRAEGGTALGASDVTVGRTLRGAGLVTVGRVDLSSARVGGSLWLHGAHLSSGAEYTMHAGLLDVGQDLICQDGFVADGGVNLGDARVGGLVAFAGARLFGRRTSSGGRGTALHAYGLRAERGLSCIEGFTARGKIDLSSAVVDGALGFDGARLHNPDGEALDGTSMTVRNLFCRKGFTATGAVVLTAARVDGEVDLQGATLVSPGRHALAARALVVDGDMHCGEEFSADGELLLQDAKIGGRLDLNGAALTNSRGEHVVNLEGIRAAALGACFAWPPPGVVDLTDARVGRLEDRPDSWPAELWLSGFRYELFTIEGVSREERLGWVQRHEHGNYAPGPYNELAAAYRRAGHEEDARWVAFVKQRRRRSRLNLPGKVWNWFLLITVGYGYYPWLAVLWLAGLIGYGWFAFALAYDVGSLRPSGPESPVFHPLLYALDVMLPVGDFGQRAGWIAGGGASAVSTVLTLCGWLLVTAILAGLTNALRRE